MSKKRKKKRRQPSAKDPPKRSSMGFLLGAIGIGLLFILGGVLLVLLGMRWSASADDASRSKATTTGFWLIAMGVAAIVLSLVIYRTGS